MKKKITLTVLALAALVCGISALADPPNDPDHLQCTVCPGSGSSGVTPVPGGPDCYNVRSGVTPEGQGFTCVLISGDPSGCIYQCTYY